MDGMPENRRGDTRKQTWRTLLRGWNTACSAVFAWKERLNAKISLKNNLYNIDKYIYNIRGVKDVIIKDKEIKCYYSKNANILHDGKIKAIGEIIELDDVQAKKLAHILVPVKESTNKDKTTATKTETKIKTKNKEDETKKEESENGGNE